MSSEQGASRKVALKLTGMEVAFCHSKSQGQLEPRGGGHADPGGEEGSVLGDDQQAWSLAPCPYGRF